MKSLRFLQISALIVSTILIALTRGTEHEAEKQNTKMIGHSPQNIIQQGLFVHPLFVVLISLCHRYACMYTYTCTQYIQAAHSHALMHTHTHMQARTYRIHVHPFVFCTYVSFRKEYRPLCCQ